MKLHFRTASFGSISPPPSTPLRQRQFSESTVELFSDCAMPATSQIASTNACHSFIFEQPCGKRDASKRIPRPPNAFMLYRSDFLKRGAVPPEVEKRQQNLSRIAGQCWNMLPDTEKAIWFNKAATIRAEHRAKYPLYHTGPSHKDTNRLPTKDKKSRNATKSGRSFDRSRTRRTRAPYCEGMFAALHVPSPESQASPIAPIPAFEASLSTTPSLSSHSLPQPISPFTSHLHSSKQDSPFAIYNPVIRKCKFGYPLDSPVSEAKQLGVSHIAQDLEITPSEIDSPTLLPRYWDESALGTPYLGLEHFLEPASNPVSRAPLTLPGPNIFPPATEHPFADFSMSNAFNVMDNFTHFNPSLIPLYPLHSDGLYISE